MRQGNTIENNYFGNQNVVSQADFRAFHGEIVVERLLGNINVFLSCVYMMKNYWQLDKWLELCLNNKPTGIYLYLSTSAKKFLPLILWNTLNTHGKPGCRSKLVSSVWPCPCHFSHSGSEPVNERSFSFSFSSSIPLFLSKTFKQMNTWINKRDKCKT